MDGIKIKVYEEKNSARTGRILEYEPEDIRIGANTFQGAGAVGLQFNFPITIEAYAEPKTNVIASYVKIGGIKDGKVYYETINKSIYVYLDF
jgi:hypothetical protein